MKANIRAARLAHGWTLTDVADGLGVTVSQWDRVEHDEVPLTLSQRACVLRILRREGEKTSALHGVFAQSG